MLGFGELSDGSDDGVDPRQAARRRRCRTGPRRRPGTHRDDRRSATATPARRSSTPPARPPSWSSGRWGTGCSAAPAWAPWRCRSSRTPAAPCSSSATRPPAAPPRAAAVVVGVDGSKPSLRALAVAFDEAARSGGTLDVLHAWEAHSASDPTLSTSSSWSTYEANLEKIVESALATAPRREPRRQGRLRGGALRARAGARRPHRGRRHARRGQPRLRWLRRAARRVDRAAPDQPRATARC